MMKELEQYIQSHFKIIQPEQLNQVSSLFKSEILKKGDNFLRAGRICDKLCFIQSGLLRVFTTKYDKEVTQWIATKGYFGTDLSSFYFKIPSRWTIQALSDTEIYFITHNDYNKIINIVPTWNELEKNFIIQCVTYMEDRIFSHLSMSAEERYNSFFESNKELFNQVPLQYIASILGMTPETFSRIRKRQLM
ncbi:Crp/Fnr family transcriptional regulator [Chryseobacterium sp. BIGb0232]|uniref:Crp/Fnr family transcriptional regulator n=1 Tax=Chryseobacterium sp. BIGb0232 TaxID=2940598 RepID=UPI001E45D9D4|nr:Crp/Fnr family transcriptional regulator [Chryseobacterium sp. BIGb0232]MCS4302220.1 CRP-like cAMP-binding protein [Chryseobacterium sp. BIGb0232]